ncbi:hypothetical protein IDH08_01895 [Pelagibacterales bacterium SAG-MED22]|nr:hypothetical protein [Pelagibacterales bacterium SAG-MED22]
MTISKKNNKECNLYIPRTIYSLFLILSKEKVNSEDNFVIINNYNLEKIPKNLIKLLKKKKFKIIFINKNYSYKNTKVIKKNKIINFFGIYHFLKLNEISNLIIKTNYLELGAIKFEKYQKINIYYSSNLFYFSNFCKKFNNVNLYFLEHGSGNFLSFVYEDYKYNNSYKYRIKILMTSLFFKLKGIYIPNKSFYLGIFFKLFNIKSLTNNNYTIEPLNLNFKKGFYQILNFYKKELSKIKKKEGEYIYLQLPHAYEFRAFKEFLEIISKKNNFNNNSIFIIKLKSTHFNKRNKYNTYLKNFFKKEKINYYFLSEKFKMIPAEIIIEYFKVKEIYSAYSTILFSPFYFSNRQIKINAFFSSLIKKKYRTHIELMPFINNFIKNKFINKKVNYINNY